MGPTEIRREPNFELFVLVDSGVACFGLVFYVGFGSVFQLFAEIDVCFSCVPGML